MNEQHFMLTVYSNFYKGYSVHAESDFTITRLYLTLGVDTHPRLFLDEISNNEIANKIDTGEWEEYLKNLITIDVEKEFNIVNIQAAMIRMVS